jgi:tryptophan-rich sensory protein
MPAREPSPRPTTRHPRARRTPSNDHHTPWREEHALSHDRHERRRRLRTTIAVTAAVAATAVAGSVGTKVDTPWFRALDKPSWYPPRAAFPIAWTALYAMIAWSTTRALNRAREDERRAITRALAGNLALNAGWTWAFFRAQRPDLALGTVLALDVSNLSLLGRVRRVDTPAAAALVPYAAWTAFATALTEEIWYRNDRG